MSSFVLVPKKPLGLRELGSVKPFGAQLLSICTPAFATIGNMEHQFRLSLLLAFRFLLAFRL
jgi:hypothetical protein